MNALVLHEEPKTPNQVTKLIDMFVKLQKDDPDTMDVFYNVVQSGESITNPKTRKPPLRGHYSKLMTGALGVFAATGKIPDNVVFVIFNGSKDGAAQTRNLMCFQQAPTCFASKNSCDNRLCNFSTRFDKH